MHRRPFPPVRRGLHARRVCLVPLVALAALLAGCSPAPAPPAATSVPETASAAPTAGSGPVAPEVDGDLATGLAVPWAMAELPDSSVLVTHRDDGTVSRISPSGTVEQVGTVEGVVPDGEGGLMGIAVEPGRNPQHVFVYLTAAQDNRIARLGWNGRHLSGQAVILDGIPKASIHDGGRIAFGPDGFLYAGTGDAGNGETAQQPDSLGGKILRITTEGEPAPGNPDPSSPVWSLGHRNVQGLAWDADGRLWASEFGQNDVDELNLIQRGGNYGWPRCEGPCDDPGVINPAQTWSPTALASPSGLAIAAGSAWVASLRGEVLWQVPLDGTRAGEPIDRLSGEYGRLRDVLAVADDKLLVATSNTDGRGDPRSGDDRIVVVGLVEP